MASPFPLICAAADGIQPNGTGGVRPADLLADVGQGGGFRHLVGPVQNIPVGGGAEQHRQHGRPNEGTEQAHRQKKLQRMTVLFHGGHLPFSRMVISGNILEP